MLGKPKGTIQSSMYDKDRERIQELLALGVPQKHIVEAHLGYGTTKSLSYYIRTQSVLQSSGPPHENYGQSTAAAAPTRGNHGHDGG
jgi:hypothetical protein